MQFLLLAYDATDAEAHSKRLKVRPSHLENVSILRKKGEFLFGGAILDENGQMIGSMIVYEYPDRGALDMMLRDEPYIKEGVWEKIYIRPFRLAVHN